MQSTFIPWKVHPTYYIGGDFCPGYNLRETFVENLVIMRKTAEAPSEFFEIGGVRVVADRKKRSVVSSLNAPWAPSLDFALE
mmetsp:Transcript_26815/g.65058  ORF Transcript_26815/g.65058 Transcript_26815/m.65058 type:complete len:82 (+) Transcript_26815:1535-1780(+)